MHRLLELLLLKELKNEKHQFSAQRWHLSQPKKTQQTKPKFPNPPEPPNNQNKNSSNKERQRKKASKPTKETTQLSPNHTLQAQKCSKQPYILRNSSSFRRFLSSDSEVSRVSKAADKRERERERERLGLAIFDAFVQRRSLGAFSFYWPISDKPIYLSDLQYYLLYLQLCPYQCLSDKSSER